MSTTAAMLIGKLEVEVIEAMDLPNADKSKKNPGNMSDPFVNIKLSDGKKSKLVGKTPTIDDSLHPKWNYKCDIDVNQEVREIIFEVMDDDTFKDDKLGGCTVPVGSFQDGRSYQEILSLKNKKGVAAGRIHIKINYMSR